MKGTLIIFAFGFICAFVLLCVLWAKFSSDTKKEKKAFEEENEKLKKQNKKYVQEKKENEELIEKVNSGDNLDSFDASVELLQKQSQKGKARNS